MENIIIIIIIISSSSSSSSFRVKLQRWRDT